MKSKEHCTIRKDSFNRTLFKCSLCPSVIKGSSYGEFNRHYVKHMQKRQYTCNDCKKTFNRIDVLDKHASWCTKVSKDYKDRGASTYMKLKENQHYKLDKSNEKKYKCLKCNANLASFLVLRIHYLKHSDIRPFECNICLKTFARLDRFKIHYKTCKPDTIIDVKKENLDENIMLDENKDLDGKDIKREDTVKKRIVRRKAEKIKQEDKIHAIDLESMTTSNIILINIDENENEDTSIEFNSEKLALNEDTDYKIITDEKEEMIYVCLKCEHYSPHVDDESFKQHFLTNHLYLQISRCKFCEKALEDEIDLQIHELECPLKMIDNIKEEKNSDEEKDANINTKNNRTLQKCTKCKKVFTNVRFLQQHLQTIHGEVTIKSKFTKCKTCGKDFASKTNAKLCELKDKQLFNAKCKLCDKQFLDPSLLKRHFQTTHFIQKIKCETCGVICKNKVAYVCHRYYNHRQTPSEEKCLECGKILPNKLTLKQHMRRHVGHVCYLCGKNLKKNLKDHIARHLNERNYVCGICQKKFFSKNNLNRHKTIHKNFIEGIQEADDYFVPVEEEIVHSSNNPRPTRYPFTL